MKPTGNKAAGGLSSRYIQENERRKWIKKNSQKGQLYTLEGVAESICILKI